MRRTVALLTAAGVVLLIGTVHGAATNAFKPLDGRYAGTSISGNRRAGAVRLEVGGFLRPETRQLPAVRLVRWSGKLRCPGHRTQLVKVQLSAARIGRTFSGLVIYRVYPFEKDSLTGRFTARDALAGTVRVRRRNGTTRCDTGRVTFIAHRVGT